MSHRRADTARAGLASDGGFVRVAIGLGFLAVLGLLLLFATWLFAGPLIGLAAGSVEVTGDPKTDLPGLQERSVVRAADGSDLAVLSDEFDREVVELSRIPQHVRRAVITAEDRNFYEHEGYDANAIFRAAMANFFAGEVEQGASTITQQLAQINFLRNEKTIQRKLEEVSVARALEEEYDKDQLLAHYLNQVYFGSGAYGVQAAAQEYFRVLVEDLTVEQSALLAGMIRSPSNLNPRDNPEGAKARRDAVLQGMAEEGYIERGEADRLAAQPLAVEPPLERSSDDPYVVEAVKREFFANDTFGETKDERIELLFRGGVQVHTTVHPKLQRVADKVISEAFAEEHGPTAALAAVHPTTGGIFALHGGEDFDEVKFDLATQGRRQPGSALKPVAAATALEQGFSLDRRLKGNSPQTYNAPELLEPFEVRNFENSDHGSVDLREALVSSVNTAFAQLIMEIGVEETIELAGQLGINVDAAFGSKDTWGPSIVLGGLTHGVTPLEMASVYATFANKGISTEPYLIEQVTRDGEVLYDHDPVAKQVLDPAVAAAMVDMLQDVVARGTATNAQLPDMEPIGKTGTTQDNTDAWFSGAMPTLSTAVWVGHPERQVPMPGMTGGSLPAQLWQQFMATALADLDVPGFADDEVDRDALPGQASDEDDDGSTSGSSEGSSERVSPSPRPTHTHAPSPSPPPPPSPSPRPSPSAPSPPPPPPEDYSSPPPDGQQDPSYSEDQQDPSYGGEQQNSSSTNDPSYSGDQQDPSYSEEQQDPSYGGEQQNSSGGSQDSSSVVP